MDFQPSGKQTEGQIEAPHRQRTVHCAIRFESRHILYFYPGGEWIPRGGLTSGVINFKYIVI